MSQELETLRGCVEHIIFHNSENGYTVLELTADGGPVTAVGVLADVGEGTMIEAEGTMTVHPTYGEQFKISSWHELPMEGAVAIERYLAAGNVKGIRKTLAHKIVKKFGDDTLRIMEEEPSRLTEIKGITERKAREIAESMLDKKDQRDTLVFLAGFGISQSLAVRLYRTYGGEIRRILRENPYRLADDVTGIGFKIADDIARRIGFQADSAFRVKSAIKYVLQNAGGEGHIYLPVDVLFARTRDLLGLYDQQPGYADYDSYYEDMAAAYAAQEQSPAGSSSIYTKPASARAASLSAKETETSDFTSGLLSDSLRDLVMDREVTLKNEDGERRAYETKVYKIELACAKMLHDLNVQVTKNREKLDEQAREKIRSVEKDTGIVLDDMQENAVVTALSSGLFVLTGGPGTGKTTTINTMIRVFEDEGRSIALAAPTGRAAKRMSEATGREAKTIHRLLEVSGEPGEVTIFQRDDDNPLEEDVIIIDETSMVDIYLLHALLKAIPVGAHLILVGDSNQLPSVGPGAVLRDIIASEVCPVVRLTTIFRQAQESDIVVNAHRINRGEYPVISNQSRDFFFMKRLDANEIIGLSIKLIQDNLPRFLNVLSSDIQVLTPMKKGPLGVERLNQVLQRYLNPAQEKKREHQFGDTLFREGDRIMQIRNDYEAEWEVRGRHGAKIRSGKGIFNGDMGVVSMINPYDSTLTVEFDEHRFVEYKFEDLDQLTLAYAVTIHKSQGSEYPAVILPLLHGPHMLMNRNLLYTAITRAKSLVVIIGDDAVIREMVDNHSEEQRYTTLRQRLIECADLRPGDDPFAGFPDEHSADALR